MAKRKRKWNGPVLPAYDREVWTVLHEIKVQGLTDKEVIERCKGALTIQTLRNWRKGYENGGTRYPYGIRVAIVADALGFYRPWIRKGTKDLSNVALLEPQIWDEPEAKQGKRRKPARQIKFAKVKLRRTKNGRGIRRAA